MNQPSTLLIIDYSQRHHNHYRMIAHAGILNLFQTLLCIGKRLYFTISSQR